MRDINELKQLDTLRKAGIVTDSEYRERRKKIISKKSYEDLFISGDEEVKKNEKYSRSQREQKRRIPLKKVAVNQDINNIQSLFQSKSFIFIMSFIFPILGIPLLWMSDKFKFKTKFRITVVMIVVFLSMFES